MKKTRGKKRVTTDKKIIYLVGEGTGETINKIAKAALVQFNREKFEVKSFFMVKDRQYILRITKEAGEDRALIAFSIVQPSLRDLLIREAHRNGLKAIDVIGDFIVQLSLFLGEKPLEIPGRQYILDKDYFRRIDAINFAVKHDDGKLPHGLKEADIVLVGLSRTGKTPLSTYLANQGWKVANIPIHPDMDTPKELFHMDPKKVFGLTINVESLVKFREARLEHLGLMPYAKYADPIQVAEEIDWSIEFLKQHPRWRVIDVSSKAIEEITASIIRAYQTGEKPD